MGVITANDKDGIAPSSVAARLRTAECWCFDVDSTLIQVEGIDELAAKVNKEAEVAALTKKAMEGDASYFRNLEERLSIIRPSRKLFEECTRVLPQITPGARELIETLHARGTKVYLISGGFRQLIDPIAETLGVPLDHVYANDVRFEADGSYRDFDPQCYTACDGGKRLAINHIRQLLSTSNATVVMVGDGATDLDARDSKDGRGGADVMCGFGGVVVRETVVKGADWFVRDMRQLKDVINEPRVQGTGQR